MSTKLTFIYNANSGKLNALGHSLHKLISPATYSCSLCSLTHGFFKEKELWSNYLIELDMAVEFYHKDETDLSLNYDLPVILLETEGEFDELVSGKELSQIKKLEDLIELMKARTKA
ncbi:MAG: hypothetical protein MK132_14185 [Lentisphaerales bacterium]|nr:hypothetical protein [Lentisphaerales bacterium]